MPTNITYSIGFVEGFLEELVKEGDAAATAVLEHLHAIETAYSEAIRVIGEQTTKLEEIQLNLSGWKKI